MRVARRRINSTLLTGCFLLSMLLQPVLANVPVDPSSIETNTTSSVFLLAADNPDPAQQAFNTGMNSYRQGTGAGIQAAIQSWESALQQWEAENNSAQVAIALNWLGLAYRELGEYEQSLEQYRQLLPLTQKSQDQHTEASTLMAMAQVYAKQGQYQTALDHFDQALPLWEAVKFKTGEAATLNNLGLLYLDLGEPEQSLEYYDRSVKLLETLDNPRDKAATFNNRGQAYSTQGDLDQALQDYNQALNLWSQAKNKRGQAATLNNIGFVKARSGEFDAALNLYNQAFPLWEEVGDRSGTASTLNNICVVKTQQGQLAAAMEFCQKALDIRQEIGDRPKQALSLLRIAQIQRQQGDLDRSLETIEQALEIIETLRRNVVSQDLRTSFFATKREYYEFYIDLLMELDQQRPNQGYKALGLQASERAKARSLLEILTNTPGEVTSGIDSQLLKLKQDIQNRLEAAEERRVKLLSRQYDESQKVEIDAEVETLLKLLQQLLARIESTSPRYAALTQPQPLTLAEIQQQVLDSDTVLLEYSLGKTRSHLWVVTSTEITSYELPDEATLSKATRKFRNAFISPRERIIRKKAEDSGIALSKMLLPNLQQLQGQLRGKRLLVVADGAVQYVPFVALPLEEAPPADQPLTPLVVEHEVVTLPSASVLGILRKQVAARTPAPKALAVMADPVFSSKDDRLKNITAEDLQLSPELERSAREAGVLFDRLPFTQQEAENILALVPETERTQRFGFEARREFITQPELSQYRLLHIATHGLLNSETPELSGLVFSLVDESGEAVNGFLRLYEIFNLDLPAELAVLSACETGLGKDIKGEGLVSLTRGFMYAGTPRVVVSLWAVDDQATSVLMTQFYQQMLQQGYSPAAALRQAQIEMWQQQDWRSPYFWAAFTLQGEWRNLN